MIRRLWAHPHVELVRVTSVDHIGEPISVVHHHLDSLTDLRFEDLPPREAVRDADVVLLGLPHEVSLEVVPELVETGVKIVDMSAAFRLSSPATYKERYGRDHPAPELLAQFVYGLTEVEREAIRCARFVANPGCFATCVQLGLLPFAQKGWLVGTVATTGMTGSSGSGAEARITTHHPIRSVNLRAYSALGHVQAYEMDEGLRRAGGNIDGLDFVPVSAPLSRGIFVTSFAELEGPRSEQEIRDALEAAVDGEQFIRVPRGRSPEVAAVSGSNYVELGVEIGARSGNRWRVVCLSAVDNLIKGGAGQAIQNANLMLGLDEATTLVDPGNYP